MSTIHLSRPDVCKKGRVCAIKSAWHKGPESLSAPQPLPLIGTQAQELGCQSSTAKEEVPAKDLCGECRGVWLTWVEECRERHKASSRS